MYYKLRFNMELIDESIEKGYYPIYAEESNLIEIEYPGIKKGWFRYVFFENEGKMIHDWPVVEYYYSSKASHLENEYLNNVTAWPIVHKKVQREFEKNNITGIQYLPIELIDVVTNEINHNYVVMNILNWIDGIDMEASSWEYDEEEDVYFFDFRGIVLDEQKCKGYDIFRCQNDEVRIYVSEKVKEIAEKNNWIWFALSEMPSTHKEKKINKMFNKIVKIRKNR